MEELMNSWLFYVVGLIVFVLIIRLFRFLLASITIKELLKSEDTESDSDNNSDAWFAALLPWFAYLINRKYGNNKLCGYKLHMRSISLLAYYSNVIVPMGIAYLYVIAKCCGYIKS